MLKIIRAKYSARLFLLVRNRIALTELNYVVNGSNIQWREKSFAASVPTDVPKSRRYRKVTKDERKAMVESFVNKYRVTHHGKFPTTSVVYKNVGGSYYVVRIILQELLHKSKTSSLDGTGNLLGDGLIKVHEGSVDGGTQNEADEVTAIDVEIVDARDEHLEAEGVSFTSSVAEGNLFEEVEKPTAPDGKPDLFAKKSNLMKGNSNDVSSHSVKPEDEKTEGAQENHLDFVAKETHPLKEETEKTFYQGHDTAENSKKEEADGVPYFVATESHLLKRETDKVSHPSAGNADEKDEQVLSEVSVDSDDTKHEDTQYKGSPKLEKSATDISSRQTDVAEVPKKSTLWGNLKSFADVFFSMWRKS